MDWDYSAITQIHRLIGHSDTYVLQKAIAPRCHETKLLMDQTVPACLAFLPSLSLLHLCLHIPPLTLCLFIHYYLRVSMGYPTAPGLETPYPILGINLSSGGARAPSLPLPNYHHLPVHSFSVHVWTDSLPFYSLTLVWLLLLGLVGHGRTHVDFCLPALLQDIKHYGLYQTWHARQTAAGITGNLAHRSTLQKHHAALLPPCSAVFLLHLRHFALPLKPCYQRCLQQAISLYAPLSLLIFARRLTA